MPHIPKDVASLVVGDFNSCATFQVPVLLTNSGFVDSFAALNENPDSHPTWHWPTKYGEVSLQIDFVFHSRAFRTTESRLIKTEGADHYLLLSKLLDH